MDKRKHFIAGNGKYLLSELCHYKPYSILLPFMGCAAQIAVSIVTIYMPKLVLDMVEQRAAFLVLIRQLGLFGILLAVCSMWDKASFYAMESCARTFMYTRLIKLWEEKVMDMEYEAFASPRGKLLTEKARIAVSSPNRGVVKYLPKLAELVCAVARLLLYSAVIAALHPVILLFLLVMFGIELWFGTRTENKKQELKEARAEASRKLNYIAYGTRGMQEGKDIRIYSMASWLRQVTKAAIEKKTQVEKSCERLQFQKMCLTGVLIFVRDGAAYWYLIVGFLQGRLSIGDFALYFSAITGLGEWLIRLSEGIAAFMEANNYVTDFREFMELGNKAVQGRKADELIKPVSFVFENVSFSYWEDVDGEKKEISVLKNINLEIAAGEKLALVGINGAGKTTFVKLLCGMLMPQSGRILVNGIDSAEFSKEEYYSLFSAVFQKSGALPVSIADNVMLNVGEQDRLRMMDCLRMAGLLKKVEALPEGAETCLIKRVSEHGTELSGGELQRLLLARALYKDAPVLILDEPTAAMDPIAEYDMYQKYHQFTKDKTAVFISHRLASTRFCDRVILLNQGKIAESGTHEELMEQGGKYAEMFGLQSRYYESDELREGGKKA